MRRSSRVYYNGHPVDRFICEYGHLFPQPKLPSNRPNGSHILQERSEKESKGKARLHFQKPQLNINASTAKHNDDRYLERNNAEAFQASLHDEAQLDQPLNVGV